MRPPEALFWFEILVFFWKFSKFSKLKKRGTDGVVRGVGYISTCTGINIRPIAKPFEMGAYWSVIKRSIFLFDHRMVENWNFGHFWKKFDTFWALGASKLVKKNFEKNWKNRKMMKFFFIFVCIMFCLLYYVPQTCLFVLFLVLQKIVTDIVQFLYPPPPVLWEQFVGQIPWCMEIPLSKTFCWTGESTGGG